MSARFAALLIEACVFLPLVAVTYWLGWRYVIGLAAGYVVGIVAEWRSRVVRA